MNNQKILNGGSKNGPIRGYLTPEDLVILIQDVVDSHPGLGFLKEATEFHSRYVHTVSQYTKIYHIYRMKCTVLYFMPDILDHLKISIMVGLIYIYEIVVI